jgi:RNA polymerase sigma-70 factor, ECF subfamily
VNRAVTGRLPSGTEQTISRSFPGSGRRRKKGTIMVPGALVRIGRSLGIAAADEGLRESYEDAALVSAAQAGNADAYGTLVDKYHHKVFGIVYRMCGPSDADDITQEVFVRALTALRKFQFQGEASFRTWLYRIAINACINELRRRKRRQTIEGPSLDQDIETESGSISRTPPDTSRLPEKMLEQQELCHRVHEVLLTLTPKHRAVLTLVDLQGMDYEEAARTVGCPLGTLKSRVARARDAFGAKFRRYMNE